MHAFSLCLALFAGSSEVADGTLIVLENSNWVVEKYTKSEITHLGVILHEGGVPLVYEATPRVVRRVSLDNYYAELAEFNRRRDDDDQLRIALYEPKRAYTDAESQRMKKFLDSQLGRRYSIKGIVRKKPGDGIHCAELVSSALQQTGRYEFDRVYAVSPAVLVELVRPFHAEPVQVACAPRAVDEPWCQRTWNWWASVFSWCGWACQETWLFCR